MGQGAAGITRYGQRIAMQAMLGGVTAERQGGRFGHGFASAGLAAMVMPQIGAGFETRGGLIIAGAIAGGTISVMIGRRFANGADLIPDYRTASRPDTALAGCAP